MSKSHAEVCDEWIRAGVHDTGKSSTMSYRGPVLYSYSTPIGFIDHKTNVVFLSTHRYSATTSSKHYTARDRAIPSGFLVVCPELVSNSEWNARTPADMLSQEAEELIDRLKTLHRRTKYAQGGADAYNHDRARLLEAYSRYDLAPPHLPEITSAGYLFPNVKAAIKRAQEELCLNSKP